MNATLTIRLAVNASFQIMNNKPAVFLKIWRVGTPNEGHPASKELKQQKKRTNMQILQSSLPLWSWGNTGEFTVKTLICSPWNLKSCQNKINSQSAHYCLSTNEWTIIRIVQKRSCKHIRRSNNANTARQLTGEGERKVARFSFVVCFSWPLQIPNKSKSSSMSYFFSLKPALFMIKDVYAWTENMGSNIKCHKTQWWPILFAKERGKKSCLALKHR